MSVAEVHIAPLLDACLMADDRSRFLRERLADAPPALIRNLLAAIEDWLARVETAG